MTKSFATELAPSVALLEQSATYLLGSLVHVTDSDLDRSTPCDRWDLGTLLHHVADSADACAEALSVGSVNLSSPPPVVAADPVSSVRNETQNLLAACHHAPSSDALCGIGDRTLWTSTTARVGAVELAVHGWDIATAIDIDRQMPGSLATALKAICRQLITDFTSHPEFGQPVLAASPATPTDELVASLGRSPRPRA
jgi:uncharacterized protein (TIGR03086 family)